MSIFNPKILDASLRDVASCLSDNDKVDLLLYALRNLELRGRARPVIENAVQSCLQVTSLSPENVAQAHVLRAKARLAGGSNHAAQMDLEAAIAADPDHLEANHLLHMRSVSPEERLLPRPRKGVRFSAEIWREIALFLPRRDLKTLLFVPHMLSRVACQLLFRKIDLHFGESVRYDDRWPQDGDLENEIWHTKRTADILTRMIVDPAFGGLVKTLKIYFPTNPREGSVGFQTGMLENALPKLVNLRNVHVSAATEEISPLMRILALSTPRLRGLSLAFTDSPGDGISLDFSDLLQFSFSGRGGNPAILDQFLSQQTTSLRSLCYVNENWALPTNSIALRNLTHVDFYGQLPIDSQTIRDILCHGHQIESLRLQCILKGPPSSQFRTFSKGLPFLRDFAFSLISIDHHRVDDRDLFPAIAEFLRGRVDLRSLGLSVVGGESAQRAVGFDASVWGVLPSLTGLKGLALSYPRDLAPSLAMWLVPRNLKALSLEGMNVPMRDPIPVLNQLRAGVPPSLVYIGFSEFSIRSVSTIVEEGFPNVKVVRVSDKYWTVVRREKGSVIDMEAWPKRRIQYHLSEWLEWLGCDDAQWRDPTDFVL